MSELGELLPCPFCGADAKRHDIECLEDIDNAGGSYIECTRCGACTQLHFDRKENLLDSWNRRVGVAEQSGAGAPETSVRCGAPTAINLCSDCPPKGYPTDKTRCSECPRMDVEECGNIVDRLRTYDSIDPDPILAEAADKIERLDGLREQAEFVIDTLESNARVQAKLLADTGRERDELRRKLALQAAKKELEYLDKGVGTATAQAAGLRACERADQVLEAANAASQSTKRGGEPNM